MKNDIDDIETIEKIKQMIHEYSLELSPSYDIFKNVLQLIESHKSMRDTIKWYQEQLRTDYPLIRKQIENSLSSEYIHISEIQNMTFSEFVSRFFPNGSDDL